jgi:hypothetical protein
MGGALPLYHFCKDVIRWELRGGGVAKDVWGKELDPGSLAGGKALGLEG